METWEIFDVAEANCQDLTDGGDSEEADITEASDNQPPDEHEGEVKPWWDFYRMGATPKGKWILLWYFLIVLGIGFLGVVAAQAWRGEISLSEYMASVATFAAGVFAGRSWIVIDAPHSRKRSTSNKLSGD